MGFDTSESVSIGAIGRMPHVKSRLDSPHPRHPQSLKHPLARIPDEGGKAGRSGKEEGTGET